MTTKIEGTVRYKGEVCKFNSTVPTGGSDTLRSGPLKAEIYDFTDDPRVNGSSVGIYDGVNFVGGLSMGTYPKGYRGNVSVDGSNDKLHVEVK